MARQQRSDSHLPWPQKFLSHIAANSALPTCSASPQISRTLKNPIEFPYDWWRAFRLQVLRRLLVCFRYTCRLPRRKWSAGRTGQPWCCRGTAQCAGLWASTRQEEGDKIYRLLTPYLDLHTLNLESSVGSMQPRNWNALSKSKLFLLSIGFVPTDRTLNADPFSRRGVHCCDSVGGL